ncbi:MAG: alpha/beta hydrolase [Bacteroidota bacterium]
MIQQEFIKIGQQVVHFRYTGQGTPIVLLHPSPSSSKMFEPFIQQLSPHFLVIAPDTIGYGKSQPLQLEMQTMTDYASFLKQFLTYIGIQKTAIYGSATGAQMGVRFALMYPKTIEHLYLDNAAHFTEEQRTDILKGYFPDLTPQRDGSHLDKIWEIATHIFKYFPWFKRSEKYALNHPTLPPSVLHEIAKDFIETGAGYSRAYRAAFDHERAEYAQQLRVPTTIFDWEGGILRPYVNQLLAHDLPTNVQTLSIPADRIARLETMAQHIQDTYINGKPTQLKNHTIPAPIQNEMPSNLQQQLPKVAPDAEGTYLKKVWQIILEHQGGNVTNAEELFKIWIGL